MVAFFYFERKSSLNVVLILINLLSCNFIESKSLSENHGEKPIQSNDSNDDDVKSKIRDEIGHVSCRGYGQMRNSYFGELFQVGSETEISESPTKRPESDNYDHDYEFQLKLLPPSSNQLPEALGEENIRQKLARDPVIVRIKVEYDCSCLNQLGPDMESVSKVIKDLIHMLQIIFDQATLSSQVKLNFVLRSVKLLFYDYPIDKSLESVLKRFASYQKVSGSFKNHDLIIYLVCRSFINLEDGPEGLGRSDQNTFCHKPGVSAVLAVVVKGFGSAYTLAHMVAHSLGIGHDSNDCSQPDSLMSLDPMKARLFWSNCSVSQLTNYLSQPEIANCIYDTNRTQDIPTSGLIFDSRDLSHRKPLPGENYDQNQQCFLSLGKSFISSVNKKGTNGPNEDVCRMLYCNTKWPLDTDIPIGPALTGTQCQISFSSGSQLGTCINSSCKPS